MTTDLYQEIILEEFAHPQHFGELPNADAVLPGVNPSCGDGLRVFVKLDDAKERVLALRWDGEGCAISIASMSLLAQKINQKQPTLQEIAALQPADVERWLGLVGGIASARIKCLTLGLSTLQKFAKQHTAKS